MLFILVFVYTACWWRDTLDSNSFNTQPAPVNYVCVVIFPPEMIVGKELLSYRTLHNDITESWLDVLLIFKDNG